MCLLIFSILASSVVGRDSDLDRTDVSGHDLDLVKDRVYRSVNSDLRNLLDSMQNQLKVVTGNLETVKRMCNVNNPNPRKGMLNIIYLVPAMMKLETTKDGLARLQSKFHVLNAKVNQSKLNVDKTDGHYRS